MNFNSLKTRKGRLKSKLSEILEKKDIDLVIRFVHEYEKDNLDTIEKLKKRRALDIKKINGALRQTINAHGPITKELIGSASKRVYGMLLDNPVKEPIFIKLFKWLNLK